MEKEERSKLIAKMAHEISENKYKNVSEMLEAARKLVKGKEHLFKVSETKTPQE